MKKIKLFFLRNKDRFLKFLLILSSVICILFSSFSVSAETASISFYSSKPEISSSTGYVEFYFANGAAFYIYVIGPSSNELLYCTISGNYISFSVSGGHESIYPLCIFVGSDGTASRLPFDASGHPYFDASGWNSNLLGTHGYGVSVSGSPSYPFTFVYGNDNFVNERLNLIISTLSSINDINSLNRSTLLSLYDLLLSVNTNIVNTYGLIHNEGELTRDKIDKIIGILEAAENGAYYNPDSDGTSGAVNNQQQKDDQVMQGTSTGRTEANNAISGFSGLLTTTGAVFKGATAITKVFNLFAQSSFIAPILQISLVLGIASFIIGTSVISLGHFAHDLKLSRNNKKNKND